MNKLEIDLEKLQQFSITVPEYCFLQWHKDKMNDFNSELILFNAREVAEDLKYSESWARSTCKKLIRRGLVKPFKKYIRIERF